MKEKIYTIPVTEAFSEDCECPLCLLEKRLEDEYTGYFLGPSLMEPDCRIETNEKGFCRRHAELLYNKQQNRLGLALTLDTHIAEQLGRLKQIYKPNKAAHGGTGSLSGLKSLAGRLALKPGSTGSSSGDLASVTADYLKKLRNKCAVCSKLEYTMDRYMDVIMYLWSSEQDFRKLFESKKGFCLKHMEDLLVSSRKYLNAHDRPEFADKLVEMQIKSLEKMRGDIDWFTKKFDYRNSDAPWGDSKDAVPRGLQKLYGYSDLK